MMADVKCPVCGQLNPPDAAFCSNCGTALQQTIQPGDAPTKKNTSELEPILPQWLRDAREKARQSYEQEDETPPQGDSSTAESDLLAGLRAQSAAEEEDSLPDWLAGITGEKQRKPPEVSGPQRVELGGAEAFEDEEQQPAPPLDEPELPPWLAALTPPKEQPSSTDALQDWLRQVAAEEEPQTIPLEPGTSPITPEQDEGTAPTETTLGWLDALHTDESKTIPLPDAAERPAEPPPGETPAAFDVPDWLKRLQSETTAPAPEEEETAPEGAFFTSLEPEEQAGPAALESEPLLEEADLPDWLKGMEPEETPAAEEAGLAEPLSTEEPALGSPFEAEPEPLTPAALDVELPDWLMNMEQPAAESTEPPAVLPDWMEAPSAEETPSLPETPRATPGWLADLGPAPEPAAEPPALPSGQVENAGLPVEPEPLPSGLDALFTEVPDWLTEAGQAPASEPAAPAEEVDFLSPASLPSWVQAMRPMEAAVSAEQARAADETLETAGPLAGLRGVLPALAPALPSSRPSAQASRLQASEEQLTHSELLEQVLLAETRPEPMSVPPRTAVWRNVRIGIGLLLFAVLLVSVFSGTSLLPLPAGQPVETMAALKAVESVEPNAPVLLVFDYEPALAGEMEAAAAPLLDHMIVLKAPRLTLLSTSPTGTALADRMFSGPLRQAAVGTSSYINLGYLPGGLSGVRLFAQNPPAAMPLDADSQPAWDSAAAQGVRSVNDYDAILVLTDNANAGRAWIEQLQPLYTRGSLVVVASAQAGPVLQPYYQSGQIKGLVTGVLDAAVVEQNNAGRPGLVRRYWDPFNFGLMAGLLILAVGALWNLAAGLRTPRAEEAG